MHSTAARRTVPFDKGRPDGESFNAKRPKDKRLAIGSDRVRRLTIRRGAVAVGFGRP